MVWKSRGLSWNTRVAWKSHPWNDQQHDQPIDDHLVTPLPPTSSSEGRQTGQRAINLTLVGPFQAYIHEDIYLYQKSRIMKILDYNHYLVKLPP